jgi:GNAT superfamily N-acetyltransferase
LERLAFGPHSIALGAYRKTRLVGFLWGYRSDVDGTFSVDWAVVRPSVVGTGVFSALMRALERRLKREHVFKCYFYTSIKNIPAIKRYLKLGYTIEGVHRNHFFGWDFISVGKILNRRRWKGDITRQPDFTLPV